MIKFIPNSQAELDTDASGNQLGFLGKDGQYRSLVMAVPNPNGGTTKFMPLTVAELSGAGELGVLYTLADGPDAGAKLTWAVPSGASTPTWCWWLWPQAAYEF